MGTNFGGLDVYWPDQLVQPERDAERIAQNIAALQDQVTKLTAVVESIGNAGDDKYHTFAEGKERQPYSCPPGYFVSAVGPTAWNSDHNDAGVNDIGVYCRKAVP
jgi:hypothetical protein